MKAEKVYILYGSTDYELEGDEAIAIYSKLENAQSAAEKLNSLKDNKDELLTACQELGFTKVDYHPYDVFQYEKYFVGHELKLF